MKNKNIYSCALLTLTLALLTPVSVQANTNIDQLHNSTEHNIYDIQSNEVYLLQRALIIEKYLVNKEFANITSFIHPTKGVRFSMYAYVQPQTDKVFSRDQFAQYLREDNIKFTWGQLDGIGDLYITTLPDYLENWLKADVYTNHPTKVSINTPLGHGNSINNLSEIYPNADYVELHNTGINPDYSGMDWRSLRLVFEQYQGDYYLVAIINDQWTI